MTTSELKTATVVVGAAVIADAARAASGAASVDELIAAIQSKDDQVRGPAWQNAGPSGAPAVKPLAQRMTDPDYETARSAKRALWVIVRHAGRPGADREAKAVATELIASLSGPPVVQREVLWMLSEIAGDEAVAPMAALLSNADLREDARCALTRMPGNKPTAELSKAFKSAPEEFKYALADSLRARGVKVSGYPTRKLVPTKQTSVKAAGR
jgi:HEAT repeat protein